MLLLHMSVVKDITKELKSFSKNEKIEVFTRFFKTGKGEYGYGDMFWGITIPEIRGVARKYYKSVTLQDISELVESQIHEVRLTGYIMLTYMYEKAPKDERENFVSFYLSNLSGVNNWDIVDLSCYKILGEYVLENPSKRVLLYDLLESKELWKERIAIVSTMALIRANEFEDTLRISKLLLGHKHDLIHKAVGWMLREVGKRDINILRKFLQRNIKGMPRTTLRYAIEKMDESERKRYLSM